jgi:hypothetical protein
MILKPDLPWQLIPGIRIDASGAFQEKYVELMLWLCYGPAESHYAPPALNSQ